MIYAQTSQPSKPSLPYSQSKCQTSHSLISPQWEYWKRPLNIENYRKSLVDLHGECYSRFFHLGKIDKSFHISQDSGTVLESYVKICTFYVYVWSVGFWCWPGPCIKSSGQCGPCAKMVPTCELEEDYQLALQKFWQTTGHLRRGHKCSPNTGYSGSGTLLSSRLTYTILLAHPPLTKQRLKTQSMTHLSLKIKILMKFRSSSTARGGWGSPWLPQVSECCGLCWLTDLCSDEYKMGSMPIDWQSRVVIPLSQMRNQRVCSKYCRFTLLNLAGKTCSRVLERTIPPIVQPCIQEDP